jgi:Response regulator of the LytR/AlgR family
MRIAICEDERSDQELLEGYCKQFNPEDSVFSFQDGESLLSAFREDCFDLVFLDIELGGLNGLACWQSLDRATPKTGDCVHYAKPSLRSERLRNRPEVPD